VPGCQGMDRAETEGKERREKSAGTQLRLRARRRPNVV